MESWGAPNAFEKGKVEVLARGNIVGIGLKRSIVLRSPYRKLSLQRGMPKPSILKALRILVEYDVP
jgi:hypothetical protein